MSMRQPSPDRLRAANRPGDVGWDVPTKPSIVATNRQRIRHFATRRTAAVQLHRPGSELLKDVAVNSHVPVLLTTAVS
jgi:hypothetical protein